ncbi:putative aldolase [compost metagenome]
MVTLGRSMSEAVDRAEELEETCKLYFLSRNEKLRLLTAAQREEIHQTFGGK